jgi:hypothetical protein
MKKGITGPANVQTLRLCEEFGLRAHWSILHGFYGETVDDYRTIAEVARRLFHLRPPLGLFRAEVERFAPMFRYPAENGLTNLRPSYWYKYCYPVAQDVLNKLAYRFDADYIDRHPQLNQEVFAELNPIVIAWREAYAARASALDLFVEGGRGVIERMVQGVRLRYRLSPAALELYQTFWRPRRPNDELSAMDNCWGSNPYLNADFAATCARAANYLGDIELDSVDPSEIYQLFLLHGLVIQEGGQAVAVARRAARQPSAKQDFERFAS